MNMNSKEKRKIMWISIAMLIAIEMVFVLVVLMVATNQIHHDSSVAEKYESISRNYKEKIDEILKSREECIGDYIEFPSSNSAIEEVASIMNYDRTKVAAVNEQYEDAHIVILGTTETEEITISESETTETTPAETVPTETAPSETTPVQETPAPETTPAPAPVQTFPLQYADGTANITIYQDQYSTAVCYAAHIVVSDPGRFGAFTGASTVSEAYGKTGAVLCVNGDYSSACGYPRARTGIVLQDGSCYAEGIYNAHTGILSYNGSGTATGGRSVSELISSGQMTDTFQFGPAFLVDGQIRGGDGGNRRPRTFMGTNGAPGDIWIVVAEGDYADGCSIGLTQHECAAYLQAKGCTFGLPLDGGGSSEMIFQGRILNHPSEGHERGWLNDFVFVR